MSSNQRQDKHKPPIERAEDLARKIAPDAEVTGAKGTVGPLEVTIDPHALSPSRPDNRQATAQEKMADAAIKQAGAADRMATAIDHHGGQIASAAVQFADAAGRVADAFGRVADAFGKVVGHLTGGKTGSDRVVDSPAPRLQISASQDNGADGKDK